jgi:aspartate/methionine/tyrosine aminotransferase
MAHWYEHYYNVKLSPNNEIQPLIGSKEGILMISLAFLNPGDGVLVPNPGYPTYSSVSCISGAEVYNYNLNESNGWMPNFDELESMPTEKIKLMWVNYPHMPTGTPANLQLFEKLVSFGKRHNIIIVNDNPYSFILNDKPLSILQVDGAKDIAIELNSLSKSHNMAGWRIGMMASNSQFISWILKIQSNIESGQFRPMMLAAAEALKCDDSWYKELNTVYSERRIIAEKIMESLGCYFDPSQRGLFLWGRIPNNYLSSEDLADKVLSEARVFITPGFIFGSNGDRYVRISLCAKSEKMEEALARINNCKSFR